MKVHKLTEEDIQGETDDSTRFRSLFCTLSIPQGFLCRISFVPQCLHEVSPTEDEISSRSSSHLKFAPFSPAYFCAKPAVIQVVDLIKVFKLFTSSRRLN